MTQAFNATWLGDSDPGAQIIHMGDLRFIKGEPTKVPGDHTQAQLIRGNPVFAVGVENDEPVNAGADAERASIQAELDKRGLKVRANASVDAMREALAKA